MDYKTKSKNHQDLELIESIKNLLETATQAAGQPIGVEAVTALINQMYQTKPVTIGDILDEVRNVGVPLTPGLVKKIQETHPEIVQDAVAIYQKSYGNQSVRNPSGLFWTILNNQ